MLRNFRGNCTPSPPAVEEETFRGQITARPQEMKGDRAQCGAFSSGRNGLMGRSTAIEPNLVGTKELQGAVTGYHVVTKYRWLSFRLHLSSSDETPTPCG